MKKIENSCQDKLDWFDGKHINEILFCQEFLKTHPMRCIGGTLFTVDGPVESEELVKRQIIDMVQSCVTTNLSKRASSLLESLKIQAYSEPLPVELDRIHCANGIYFLDGHFEPKKVFCNNRLSVSYNPDAPKPLRWLQFLSELLEEDDILTLQEYLGYCLIPSTKGQKMLMLIGRGGEGKSRIGLILNAMFHSAMNVGNIQKVETNRFARADLEHRLLMVDDDMDMSALPKTNYIKSIVTAEAKMDLERKGIQSYQGQLYVRFLCFGNGSLTSLYDHSDGFYRRQLILTTKERHAGRKDDPFLVEKMLDELEGIFLWCLEGLHRLIANGYSFTVSNRSAENVELIRRSNNNILDFLQSEGYIRFKADAESSSKAKARVGNLKQLNETVNYLSEHKLFTVEDLRKEMEQMEDARHILQEGTREKQERIKALKELLRHAEAYEELKSLQEKLNTFKFKKRREQFKQEHESDFRRFYLAKRKLKEAVPDGEPPVDVWKNELSQLEQEYRQQSAQASLLWKESKKLRELQVLVDEVLRKQGQREREQQHSDRHQDKQEERLW